MAAGSQVGFAREPFPGNILPASRLDPNAIKLLNLYPAPNNSGLFNNYADNPVLRNDVNQFDIRIDQNFSEKDSIFGRVSYSDNPRIHPRPVPGSCGRRLIFHRKSNSDFHQRGDQRNAFFFREHSSMRRALASTASQRPGCNLMPTPWGFRRSLASRVFRRLLRTAGWAASPSAGLNRLGSNNYLPSIEYSNTLQFTDNLTKHAGTALVEGRIRVPEIAVFDPAASSGPRSFQFNGVVYRGTRLTTMATRAWLSCC